MEVFSSYTGADFLVFYAVMLLTCIFAGIWIPANLREAGRRMRRLRGLILAVRALA